MTALENLTQPVDLPAVAATAERLRAGDVYVELIENKVEVRAATLAAVLGQLGDDVKLVWTGNPLRSPFTIERLILQAAGPEADLRLERTPEQLARMLTLGPDPDLARLVIVQQPETLDPIARETLARMAPFLADASPRRQILFCGSSAFQPIKASVVATCGTALMIPPPVDEPPSARSRRDVVPLLLLLAVTALGSLWAGPLKSDRAPSIASAAPPTPSPSPPPPPKPDRAALRREFDQFLAQQPSRVSNLTPEERNVLFEEYLERAHKSVSAERL